MLFFHDFPCVAILLKVQGSRSKAISAFVLLYRDLGAMAGMTPTRPKQKRRVTSPLQEMDGEEEELVELDGSGSETSAPSLSGIASIVRQEMQTAIAPVEAQLSSMQATFGNRLSERCHAMAHGQAS